MVQAGAGRVSAATPADDPGQDRPPSPPIESVAVIGPGAVGLVVAAALFEAGHEVRVGIANAARLNRLDDALT